MNQSLTILALLKEHGELSLEELSRFLCAPIEEHTLSSLIDSLQIYEGKAEKFAIPSYYGLIRGCFMQSRKGTSFLMNGEEKIFISKQDSNHAFPGEIVLIKIIQTLKNGKRYGKVIALQRNFQLVGTYTAVSENGWVTADDRSLGQVQIPPDSSLSAKNGEKVVVRITKHMTKSRMPEGEIIECLGMKDVPGVDIMSLARSFGVTDQFPSHVLQEADAVSIIDEAILSSRELLFDRLIFTIDGDDAKDLDDAVSLEHLENGNLLLGVHIADVSHYVTENSLLDQEALSRGTSVYMVDRVAPMLPKQLSNGICSLNEGETRLTLSCFMEVDPSGAILQSRIAKTAIRSRHRMTYREVNGILAGDPALLAVYPDLIQTLQEMDALALRFTKNRKKQGSIDFNIPEAKIILDQNKRPVSITLRETGRGESIIEEFMIACNNTVASEYFYKELPFVYRVHETPDPKKLKSFVMLLKNIGYNIKGSNSPKGTALQAVLDESQHTPKGDIIKRVMLRSMKKAKYSAVNLGHFGLASKAYCHFTSPIRRYPDLQIHRIIKEDLSGSLTPARIHTLESILQEVAEHASEREYNAVLTERSIDEVKMAEYLESHIGETFEATISGVTKTALFAELDNTIEGVIPLSSIEDDYYRFVEALYAVVGERTRKKYTLGDRVTVTVAEVDTHAPRIAFRINAPRKTKKRRFFR